MSSTSRERVCVFIDGSNLFLSARDQEIKIDFDKLLSIIVADRELVKAFYYDCSSTREGQNEFFDKLRLMGYDVKLTPLRFDQEGKPHQKGVDVFLVTDIVSLAHNNAYDTAILCRCDKDFLYAISKVKELGKRVEIAGFDHATAKELKRAASRYRSLTEHKDDIKRIGG